MANLTVKRKKKRRTLLPEMGKVAVLAVCIMGFLVLIKERTILASRMEEPTDPAARAAMSDRSQANRSQPENDPAVSETPDAAADGFADTPVDTPVPPRNDGLPTVDLNDWRLRLVSSSHLLDRYFIPDLEEIERGEQFDERAAQPLKDIIAAARNAGYDVYVCSCYRSYEDQDEIYWNHIYEYQNAGMDQEQAMASTLLAVCYPGGSEHQLGLAADILESADQEMEPWIGGSGLMLWLEQNCAEYGFVIRYPYGKTNITGVEYEPWHLRYVGKEVAKYMTENNLCLEEFLALYEQ